MSTTDQRIEHDRLLPLMISHSCEVACEINPIFREPQWRRSCHERSVMKHILKLQKGQEERENGSKCRRRKKALLSAFSDLSSVASSNEFRERHPPEEYSRSRIASGTVAGRGPGSSDVASVKAPPQVGVLLGGRIRCPFLFSAFVITLHVADFPTPSLHGERRERDSAPI